MNKVLNYGICAIIGLGIGFSSCGKKKPDILKEAEKLGTWHKEIDESIKMTQEQKEQFKLITADSEFQFTHNHFDKKEAAQFTDSTIVGNFIKNGNIVASVYSSKRKIVYSQPNEGLIAHEVIEKKVQWASNSLTTDIYENTDTVGNKKSRKIFDFNHN